MSCFVIAEAGVNHNGDMALAHELIDAAADAKADAVKFQTFRAIDLATADAKQAEYQHKNSRVKESQLEMLKRLEIKFDQHQSLIDHCHRRQIQFLSTAFDTTSLDFLISLDLPVLKCPSGEITNAPLLWRMAQSGRPVILSTGMCDLKDIAQALVVLDMGYRGQLPARGSIPQDPLADAPLMGRVCGQLSGKVSLLHCTTAYPTPDDQINLSAMTTLHQVFGLDVGLSDHSQGILASTIAAGMGAKIVEKHFTLDRGLPGPDHAASLEPTELAAMVQAIRSACLMRGLAAKGITPAEAVNLAAARKSLVAVADIAKGEIYTPANLGVKRPGTGLSPLHYWDLLGKPAQHDYAADTLITDQMS